MAGVDPAGRLGEFICRPPSRRLGVRAGHCPVSVFAYLVQARLRYEPVGEHEPHAGGEDAQRGRRGQQHGHVHDEGQPVTAVPPYAASCTTCIAWEISTTGKAFSIDP